MPKKHKVHKTSKQVIHNSAPTAKVEKKIDRVSTGIPGLDRLIGGGLVKGSTILVSGGPGVGKSIFCYQYINHGLENGESCLFVSFESSPDKIRNEAGDFGWDFAKHEKTGKLAIMHIDPTQLAEIDLSKYRDVTATIIHDIKTHALKMKVTRIVVDPISVFNMFLEGKAQIRRRIYEMIKNLSETKATLLMSDERPEGEQVGHGAESFVADGLLHLYYTGIGGEEGRHLEIRKLRRTKHQIGYFPFDISGNGLSVKKEGISVLMK